MMVMPSFMKICQVIEMFGEDTHTDRQVDIYHILNIPYEIGK
jgi:hypothetical protein